MRLLADLTTITFLYVHYLIASFKDQFRSVCARDKLAMRMYPIDRAVEVEMKHLVHSVLGNDIQSLSRDSGLGLSLKPGFLIA